MRWRGGDKVRQVHTAFVDPTLIISKGMPVDLGQSHDSARLASPKPGDLAYNKRAGALQGKLRVFISYRNRRTPQR